MIQRTSYSVQQRDADCGYSREREGEILLRCFPKYSTKEPRPPRPPHTLETRRLRRCRLCLSREGVSVISVLFSPPAGVRELPVGAARAQTPRVSPRSGGALLSPPLPGLTRSPLCRQGILVSDTRPLGSAETYSVESRNTFFFFCVSFPSVSSSLLWTPK